MKGIENAQRDYAKYIISQIGLNITKDDLPYIQDLNGYWFNLVPESQFDKFCLYWGINRKEISDYISKLRCDRSRTLVSPNAFFDFYMESIESASKTAFEISDETGEIKSQQDAIKICNEIASRFDIKIDWKGRSKNNLIFLDEHGKKEDWNWNLLEKEVDAFNPVEINVEKVEPNNIELGIKAAQEDFAKLFIQDIGEMIVARDRIHADDIFSIWNYHTQFTKDGEPLFNRWGFTTEEITEHQKKIDSSLNRPMKLNVFLYLYCNLGMHSETCNRYDHQWMDRASALQIAKEIADKFSIPVSQTTRKGQKVLSLVDKDGNPSKWRWEDVMNGTGARSRTA